MERTAAMPPARWLSRAAAFLLLCAAPLFAHPAVAEDPPAPAAPAAAPAEPEAAAPEPATGGSAGASAAVPGASAPAAASPAPAPALKTPSKPPKKRRGGIHPCMTPDPGFGSYDKWSRAPSMGQMIAPKSGGVRKDGGFDLVIHFHGHEPIRKEFVKTSNGVVLVGIDLGIGSGAYQTGFGAPQAYTRLIASVEAEMAKRSGNAKAHVRKLALSAWSAGYGAIDSILRQTGGKNIDAVILLDGLHTGYDNAQTKTLKPLQMEPFAKYAKQAAAGKSFMFVSQSSIIPPGYSSTTETSDYLIKFVGGKPVKTKREDVLGLDMFRKYDKGNFHVRGYDGDDKPDHCAHLGLIAGIMKVHLLPRWKTPQTKTTSPKQPAAVKTPAAKAKDDKKPAAKDDKDDKKPAAKDDKKAVAKDDKKPAAKDDKKASTKTDKKATAPAVKKVASKKDDKPKKK